MKSKLIFAAEVLAVFAVAYLVQTKLMPVPVIGEFLPGGKPAGK
jgi:hypothetical protein